MEIITLGIGTPSDIPTFLLLGLDVNPTGVGDPEPRPRQARAVYETVTGRAVYGAQTARGVED